MVDLIDTNGVKPTLKKGVLGYDDYSAGGDAGRLYVGTGTESIAQAKKSEVDAKVSLVTSTDNAIVRFNGVSGQVQNSGVIIDDNNNIGVGISSPTVQLDLLKATGSYAKLSDGTYTLMLGADTSSTFIGTISNHPLRFITNNSEKARFTTNGDFLLDSGTGGIGYGGGAGGTVTQLTSKSTAVTLNKPTGTITMNNAALAGGANVQFTVNNSLVSINDAIVINQNSFAINTTYYRFEANAAGNGAFNVRVTNITGTSFSDAIPINFTIIKGANA